jgi:transcriptional regulator with XRE-family HTH domain
MSVRRTSLIENFAANVANLRRLRGLSQAQLARISGVHRSNLNRMEKATLEPTLSTIEKLADTLGIDGWELLRAPVVPRPPPRKEKRSRRADNGNEG